MVSLLESNDVKFRLYISVSYNLLVLMQYSSYEVSMMTVICRSVTKLTETGTRSSEGQKVTWLCKLFQQITLHCDQLDTYSTAQRHNYFQFPSNRRTFPQLDTCITAQRHNYFQFPSNRRTFPEPLQVRLSMQNISR